MNARHSTGVLFVLMLSAALAQHANADFIEPPMAKPAWWVDPPGGTTRLQYHSFQSDPDNNQAPDYTRNGYEPNPNFPDDWTIDANATYNNVVLGPVDDDWGDGRAMRIGGFPTAFNKRMGNQFVEENIKHYFVEIVWKYDGGIHFGDFDLIVQAPGGSAVTETIDGDMMGEDNNGWRIQRWEGTIDPQPDWEMFRFVPPQDVLVDSVWIGTHCVPEPGTIALLGLGALALFRRRR